MKNLFLFTAAAFVFCTLVFCKNTPLPEGQKMVSDNMPAVSANPAAPLPMGKLDSLVGIKGCEKATWSPLTATSEEFIYQHYIVKITRDPAKPGDQITVVRDSGQQDFKIPMPENGYFFGVCRDKLFVDAGTGPDGRQLFIFDMNKRTQYYSTSYCGELQVVQSERLYFMLPVEEKDVVKMPDCPQKEEWLKNDLRVGYGQRCIFNFVGRSLTKKSEWACVPMQ